MNENKIKSETSRWIHRPSCGVKTRLKVYSNTVLFNYPLYCPKCKTEKIINVMQLKMAVSD